MAWTTIADTVINLHTKVCQDSIQTFFSVQKTYGFNSPVKPKNETKNLKDLILRIPIYPWIEKWLIVTPVKRNAHLKIG